MKQTYDISNGGAPAASAFASLKERAFAFRSLAPRGADVLRASLQPIDGTVVTACHDGALVGYVALWPLHLQSSTTARDLCLLGPLMVDPCVQGAGVGSALMQAVLHQADAQTLPPVLLVGDIAYYQRFGFQAGAASRWQMPGLAAPERMLVRASRAAAALPEIGAVLPAFAPPCEKQAAA